MAREMQFIHLVCLNASPGKIGNEKLTKRNANVRINRTRRTDAETHTSLELKCLYYLTLPPSKKNSI